MASFTDQPSHFNPYISTTPVQAMVAVGMEKERQFQEGITKAQGYLDTIAGLDIMKDEDKAFLNQKLGEVKQGITKNLSGDFSDDRVVNQIGGAARFIYKNPTIQTAVVSTSNYRKGVSDIEDARKAGKSTAQNEWDFHNKANQWLSDGKTGTSFNDRYSPYVDYTKAFLDRYKELHPSSTLTQDQIRIKDGTGEISVINEHEKEGISADEIQSLWKSVSSDPNVQNQLAIDGRYKYKDYSNKNQFLSQLGSSYSTNTADVDDRIKSIQNRLLVDKTLPAAEANNAILALKNYRKSLDNDFSSMSDLINSSDNLDEVKAKLFNKDYETNLATTYSWSKDKDKITDDPTFSAHMKQAEYELQQAQFGETKRYHNMEYQRWQSEDAIKAAEFAIKHPNATTAGQGEVGGSPTITTPGENDKISLNKTSTSYYEKTTELQGQLDQGTKQLVFNIFNTPGTNLNGVKPPVKAVPVPGQPGAVSYELNVDPADPKAYKTRTEAQAAFAEAYTNARASASSGKNASIRKDFAQLVDPVVDQINNRQYKAAEIEKPFNSTIATLKNNLGIKDLNAPLSIKLVSTGDTPDKMSVNDAVNYEVYNNSSDPRVKESAKRELVASLGADKADKLMQFGLMRSGDYDKVDKIGDMVKNNPDLLNTYQKREDAFRGAQTTFQPLNTAILATKPDDKEALRQQFANIVAPYNLNNDFTKLLENAGKSADKGKVDANMYGVSYDRNSDKYYLTIARGANSSNTEVFPIKQQDALNLGFSTANPFWNKFGDRLELTNNMNTDVKGVGEASAYSMNQPQNSKYTVNYHLTRDGQGYNLNLYAHDNKGNLVLPGVKTKNSFTQESIMQLVEHGIQDSDIEKLIKDARR